MRLARRISSIASVISSTDASFDEKLTTLLDGAKRIWIATDSSGVSAFKAAGFPHFRHLRHMTGIDHFLTHFGIQGQQHLRAQRERHHDHHHHHRPLQKVGGVVIEFAQDAHELRDAVLFHRIHDIGHDICANRTFEFFVYRSHRSTKCRNVAHLIDLHAFFRERIHQGFGIGTGSDTLRA